METLIYLAVTLVAIIIGLPVLGWLCGIRYIPHNKVGIIEKLWSPKGSLQEGRIVALEGEAGFQTKILRGGVHFGFYPPPPNRRS